MMKDVKIGRFQRQSWCHTQGSRWKSKGLEVNTSGFRYNLDSPMPDYEIIKRYRELKGEIICTSSDAHTPSILVINSTMWKNLLKMRVLNIRRILKTENLCLHQSK